MIKDSLLWKIRPPDSNVDSYLFGTMHVKDEVAYKHIDKAIAVLCRCDKLLCEINLDRAQTEISPDAYMIPEGSLSTLIKPSKYEKYNKVILKSYGFDISLMDAYYPIVIFNKIAESLLNNDRGLPLDMYLWNKAKELNIETDGIENLIEHVEILRQLDIETQLKMLKSAVKHTSKFKKSIKKVTQLYADQKIQKLYKVTKSSMGSFRHILIYNRNQVMADRISTYGDHTYMYAVGAAHLAGNKGILKLLKNKKYTLTAIN